MSQVKMSGALRTHYEDYYEEGKSEWRRLGALDKAANIVSLCGRVRHGAILEIGAGEGSILKRLSDLRFSESLCALEISASGIAAIEKKKIERLAECRLFDGYQVPYDDDSFDIAVLSHVLEHVEHPRQLLYEACRVARYLFVEVPLEDTYRLPVDYVPHRVGHINIYSRRSIRWLVQSCNLRVLEHRTTNPSRATYVYQSGRMGAIHYGIKQILLTAVPGLATRVFVFHESLLCEKRRG